MKRRIVRAVLPLTLIVAALGAAACSDVAGQVTAHRTPRQFLVVLDLSGSRSELELNESRRILRDLVRTLGPDDEFNLLRMQGGDVRQPGNAWVRTMPSVKNPARPTKTEQALLDGEREDIDMEVQKEFSAAAAVKAPWTNIFATLFDVADRIVENDGRRRILVLLSDMIHDTSAEKFDRADRILQKSWLDKQQAAGQIPSLQDVCASVVGGDPSTPAGKRIQKFWVEYFSAAGASLDPSRYRQTMHSVEALLCGHAAGTTQE